MTLMFNLLQQHFKLI